MVGLDVARKDGEIHFIRRQLIHEVKTFCGLEIKWHREEESVPLANLCRYPD